MRWRERAEKMVLRLLPRVIYPEFTAPIYFERRSFPRNRLVRLLYGLFVWNYELVTVERIVEIPFVFQNLDLDRGARVLDFGCNESPVSMHLASLGYEVVGVDLNPYPFTHPNFTFVAGDFLKSRFPRDHFDAVIAISAVEHCGLAAYGDGVEDRGDEKVVGEMWRILKPGGRLLLTVPYGRAATTSWYRVYDKAGLGRLLAAFAISKAEYYAGIGRKAWRPVGEEELAAVDSAALGFAQGVACVVALKPS